MTLLPPHSIAVWARFERSADAALERPENRRRPLEPVLWPDTLPAWFRSEGFAEDLQRSAPRPAEPHDTCRNTGRVMSTVGAILAVTRVLWAGRMA